MNWLRRFLDFLIFLSIGAVIALLWTGGYEFTAFGVRVSSHRLAPLLSALLLLGVVRLFLSAGWRNSLLTLTAVAFSVALAEGMVRLAQPALAAPGLAELHRPVESVGWELVPGASGVGLEGERITVNTMGMRDTEPGEWGNTFRVAAVGDSFTFGMAVEVGDTWVEQLERTLHERAHPADVLNFGVIAHHMWQHAATIDQRVLAHKPDLVVLAVFFDDLLESVHPRERNADWRPRNPFAHLAEADTGSRLWLLIGNLNRRLEARYRHRRGDDYLAGIDERKRAIGPEAETEEIRLLHAIQTGDAAPRLYDEFIRQLADIHQRLSAFDIQLVVLHIPDASAVGEKHRQYVNQLLSTATAERGIPYVDMSVPFDAVEDPRPLYLFPIDAHTSPEGHRLIATSLADLIVPLMDEH